MKQIFALLLAAVFSVANAQSIVTVNSNASLQALSTSVAPNVMRLGFNVPGDAPALSYTAGGGACSLNSGAGDNGSQVPSADGKCWVANFPAGALDVREWGVVADGLTDNTVALQAAWTYGGTVNTDILLPASDYTRYVKFSNLTAPAGTDGDRGSAQGPLSAMRGHGVGQTVLQSTASSSTCAIAFNAPSGAYSDAAMNRAIDGFQLVSKSGSGFGYCLNQITSMSLSNFSAEGFDIGLRALDAIRIRIDNPQFISNKQAISAGTTGKSRPNQWVITNPYVINTTATSFLFFNGADIDIYGGDFEANNTSNSQGNSTIEMFGNPMDGQKGLSVYGGYYEFNGGDADFQFVQLSTDMGGSHSIQGVEEARLSNAYYVQHPVQVINSNPSYVTTVDVRGSAFWSASPYVPDASRRYFGVSNPSIPNYKITGYDSNYFMGSTESPWKCTPGSACMNLPDGHIEQWGAATSASSGTGYPVSVAWPLSCPTAVDTITATALNGGSPYATGVGASTTSGVTLYSSMPGAAIQWRMLCH